MNHFALSLQRDITATLQKPWGEGPNPLVLIGLTQAILDLGLSEQQLHATVRAYARQLSAQIHPDRSRSHSQERQQEIIGAFNAIEDFENFRICLGEFKNAHAEDRHEIALLRAELHRMRERFRSLGDEETELSALKRDFELQRQQERERAEAFAAEAKHNMALEWKELEDYKKRFRERIEAMYERAHKRREMNLEQEINALTLQINLLLRDGNDGSDIVASVLRRLSVDTRRWWRSRVGFG